MAPRSVAVLALPGVQLLDVAGPLDVFAEANAQSDGNVYDLAVVGTEPSPIITSSGRGLVADLVAPQAEPTRFDTLLVAGAPRIQDLAVRPDLLDWLVRAAVHCRRYGSVCSGAFLLGQAGLLDRRRVTTHWAVAEALAERYPDAIVEPDAIARRVAAQLVMFFKRGGGQMQFSRRGVSAPAGRSVLQEVQRWVAGHPAEDHGVDRLAERAGMSPRHFARLFRVETGLTPAAYVETVRIEAVRHLLETGDAALKQIAGACGFRDADTLRRAFMRRVGTTPAEYRRRHAGA
jgi:transcriptional regulator GlxA family with amidase domain